MKKLLLLVVFLASFQLTLGQTSVLTDSENAETKNTKPIKNVVYLELFGNSVGYSFNFERRVGDKLWGRVGASYFPGPFVESVSLPLGVSYLFGKEVNFFELGLVITPAYSEAGIFSDSENKDKEFGGILSPTIGYRYQPQNKKNLFFKIAFTPLFTTFETTFVPSGGLSVGYSF